MTAALARARYNRAYEQRRPARGWRRAMHLRPWVECPVCETPTGSIRSAGPGYWLVTLGDNASGWQDGARCKAHARTLEQRKAETQRALDMISTRLVGSDVWGWRSVDATAQGTE